MKKVSILGVLIGGIVDIVSTNILAFPFILFVLVTRVDFLGMPPEEATKALTRAIQSDWVLFTIQLIIGSVCSIFGGYIAALIARHDELLNGALSAYLCIAIGIYSIIRGSGTEPILLSILGFILSPAFGLSGGYLRLLQVKSKQLRENLAPA